VPHTQDHHARDSKTSTKLECCIKAALKKKACDLIALDITPYTTFADYFIICSGTSSRQVQAIAESIECDLKKQGINPLGVEGYSQGTWILLDYGDIVMHVFYQPIREFYQLERLWADARRVDVIR